jgi:hypothetical protein
MAAGPTVSDIGVREFQIRARVRSGADWFIWIAALSIINGIIMTTGGRFHLSRLSPRSCRPAAL